MGRVVYDISMSLDGFITAAGQTPLEPMGAGGQRLHDWAFGDDERDREVLSIGLAGTGAVIWTFDPFANSDGSAAPVASMK